jgi:agmatinase
MSDVEDTFCPAHIAKGHDPMTKGIAHILSQGTMPRFVFR